MVEETSAEPIFSNISTTFKWTYSVHHIVDHALLRDVPGLRASLARLGIYEESRGNKIPLLRDVATVAEVNTMLDSVIRTILAVAGFGFVAHPDNHSRFSAFMEAIYTAILTTQGATTCLLYTSPSPRDS